MIEKWNKKIIILRFKKKFYSKIELMKNKEDKNS